MKIIGLAGSNVGKKTRTAMDVVLKLMRTNYPSAEVELLDLADYQMVFSDGRDYRSYTGDTLKVTEAIMAADAIIIGTPIFQASIPATLKNIFDLLPVNAFRDKVVSFFVTAGSPKHFLIAEHQLKPILSYMKASIVETYVFIEEKDFLRNELINDDSHFRLARLVEDTYQLTLLRERLRIEKDAEYDF
ncbi:NADPH-dependent FMN reductase [Brochothrix campestris]|uniref:NADH-dependent FMN reductase n=1 Tax=Brochothrix campestris FSL F6-1037 TaxID=1265861 RepID=W7CZE4_9LIST|nr:NADPH-dependent FMN reductase [Brochothrix campestris]EUJ38378.1 NADH-dependent FMN reductase [Brochothrix campestris FSL F6-1037]